MDVSEAVQQRLAAASGVTTIVGQTTDGANCIFWNERDQKSPLPALVLSWVGGPGEDLDLEDEADSLESRLQCSALAQTHAEARALAKAATDALRGDADVAGVQFWSAEVERPIDLTSAGTPGGEMVHEITQDVVLRHSPAI